MSVVWLPVLVSLVAFSGYILAALNASAAFRGYVGAQKDLPEPVRSHHGVPTVASIQSMNPAMVRYRQTRLFFRVVPWGAPIAFSNTPGALGHLRRLRAAAICAALLLAVSFASFLAGLSAPPGAYTLIVVLPGLYLLFHNPSKWETMS